MSRTPRQSARVLDGLPPDEPCPATFSEYATVDGWLGEAHHRCVLADPHFLSPHVCKCGTEWRGEGS